MLNHVTPARYASQDLVVTVVGNNTELFRQLLADDSHEAIHMDPLCGQPDGEWANLAVVALDHGYLEHKVASAAFTEIKVESDPTHVIHMNHAKKWGELLSHPDSRIRQVAAMGRDAEIADAKQWEQREQAQDYFENYG